MKHLMKHLLLTLALLGIMIGCQENELLTDKELEELNLNSSAVLPNKLPIVVPNDFIWGTNGHPIATDKPYYDDTNPLHNISYQLERLKEHQIDLYRVDLVTWPVGTPNIPIGTPKKISELNKLINLTSSPAYNSIKIFPIIMGNSHINYQANITTNYNLGYDQVEGVLSTNGYAGDFEYIALCNELDLKLITPGTEGVTANEYDAAKSSRAAAYLRGMVEAVKFFDPAAKIVMNNAGSLKVGWFHLLENEGVEYDIIGYHWYSDQGSLTSIRTTLGGVSVLDYLSNEFPDKDVWITELDRTDGSVELVLYPDPCAQCNPNQPCEQCRDDGYGIEDGDPQDTGYESEQAQSDDINFHIDELSGTSVKAVFSYELLDQPNLDDGTPYEKAVSAYHGIMNWNDTLAPAQYTHKKVSNTWKNRIEETKYGYEDFVKSLYPSIYYRNVFPNDNANINSYITTLKDNRNKADLVESFMVPGSYSPWVNKLYMDIHGRPANLGEPNYWITQMQNGMTRENVIKGFCISDEFWGAAGSDNEGFVNHLYFKLADVPLSVDPSGKQFWIDKLNNGTATKTTVTFAVLNSTNAREKYIKSLYIDIHGRTEAQIAQSELDYWVGRMNNGLLRQNMIKEFVVSDEYWKNCLRDGYENRPSQSAYNFEN